MQFKIGDIVSTNLFNKNDLGQIINIINQKNYQLAVIKFDFGVYRLTTTYLKPYDSKTYLEEIL